MQDTGAISERPDEDTEDVSTETRQIRCPLCGVLLVIPAGAAGHVARCGQCKQRFRVPPPARVSESVVAGWLDVSQEAEESAPPPPPHLASEPGHPHTSRQTQAALAAMETDIRLVSCEANGALLEFSSRRLTDNAFRIGMPRTCMQCGARSHLEAHVVLFTGALVDSVSLEAEHAAGVRVLHSDEVKDLSIEQVLERLPRIPNAPAPLDLPLPYWLCDLCADSKAISGQTQINSQTGDGWCRLFIRNLRRAEEFLCGVGARGTAAHKLLARHAAQVADSPWDSLALVVQHRLQQWFQPAGDEHFLAYVPDRDHARTEDGMFGLAVSSRRLIHHTSRRHHENEVSQPLELVLAAGKIRGDLMVTFPAWKVAMKVDSDGIAKLRRGLTLGKFLANWR